MNLTPLFIGLAELRELVIPFLDVFFAVGRWTAGCHPAWPDRAWLRDDFFLGEQIDELPPARDQCVQSSVVFCGVFAEPEVAGLLGIADQQSGVEGIGLGESSLTLSKMANAVGGDEGHAIVPFDEEQNDLDVIDPGGLQDDLAGFCGWKIFQECLESLCVVGDTPQWRGLGRRDVKALFGNVAAKVDLGNEGVLPVS